MSKMTLFFSYAKIKNYHVLVDGVEKNIIQTKRGHTVEIETDAENVELVIYNTLHLRSPFWFLFSALLYLVSCFGIFDSGRWRDCEFSYCRIILPIYDGEELSFVPAPSRTEGDLAFMITGNIPLEITHNINYTDPVAKKRRRLLRILRVVCTILATIIFGIVFINMII